MKCNHCGQDPESPRTGKPLLSFDGTLQDMHLRKKVEGKPPLWIYDAEFALTGTEPPVPVQMHRKGESSLLGRLGETFEINGATFRFEHGEPPSPIVRECLTALRRHAAHDQGAAEVLGYITSMQMQLAQTRLVIQVSDVKEAP